MLGPKRVAAPGMAPRGDGLARSDLSQILQMADDNVSQAGRPAKRNGTELYKLLARHQ